MEVLHEVYFGRAPVMPLENQLSIIRKKFMDKPITPTTNSDSDIIKFNRLAEKIFGFNIFSLYINNNNYLNARSMIIDTYLSEDDKERIIKDITANPTGFKYKNVFPGISIVVEINSGVINQKDITDEEIMAVIMHEIGHGFFDAVTNPDNAFTSSKRFTSMILSINKIAKDNIKRGRQITDDVVDRDVNIFSNAVNSIKKSVSHLTKNIFKNNVMKSNMVGSMYDYTNEKFADTFAAMYGYGDIFHRALLKMDSDSYKVLDYKKDKKSHIKDIFNMYKLYLFDLIEYNKQTQGKHPESLARVKMTVDYLKREIAKEGLDPAVKKELVGELNRVYDIIESYKNVSNDTETARAVKMYQYKLYKKFGGDRREKDSDNGSLLDFIDSRFDTLNNPDKGIEEANGYGFEDDEESIVEASNYTDLDFYFDDYCASADSYNESAFNDIKKRVIGISDLYKQWMRNAKSFVVGKWIYRYITDKQEEQLKKHYEVIKAPDITYSKYKKSFDAICKFIGIPSDGTIIHDMHFNNDSTDKDQKIFALQYSKGKIKVNIPEGIHLIHATPGPIEGTALNPTFRGKVAGHFLYPTNRVYFTCIKPVNNRLGGFSGANSKRRKYTPKDPITTAYIDPTCPDIGTNAVYVETNSPIPVVDYYTILEKIVGKDKKSNNDTIKEGARYGNRY